MQIRKVNFKRFIVPRSLVLFVDFIVILVAFITSYFVVKQFQFPLILRGHLVIYTATFSVCSLLIFFLMRIHTGVIRFSTFLDMSRIFAAIIVSSFLYAIVDKLLIKSFYNIHSLRLDRILVVNFFVSSSALIMLRLGVRGFYYYIKRNAKNSAERVVIFGSDGKALVIKQALESSDDSKYHVVGFLADQEKTQSIYIQQKRVFNFKHLPLLKSKHKVDRLVITSNDLSEGYKQIVVNKCLELGIKILTVPPSQQWVYGRLKLKQIQDLKIEDLLHRDPILISDTNIFSELSGKRILVTGAAGSIGSEIIRQVLKYRPAMIILLDQAESPLHEIQLEAEEQYPDIEIKIHMASVRNLSRMRIPFQQWKPEIVFHAAAYKHVPMMEKHPVEAILTNIQGTKHVADLSLYYGVRKFVMISTDKAVNPTNVMGASKRIAEIYTQSLNKPGNLRATKFMTTRFGNVLDSNGSVIPRFRAQIQSGSPVTVTHPDIVRYFMTIPEAVQLVLEAGSMGKGGEIFIFDMGNPVRIYDLAKNMIQLAGLVVDKDIKIIFTGLRPGEKLYEELLNRAENVCETHHEKIKIANVIQYSEEKIKGDVNELIAMTRQLDDNAIVKKMKQILPEYISENSIYSQLDQARIETDN